MKRLVTVLLAGLLVCAVVAPSLAWEFELKGFYENRIRYFGRMGNDDLFGKTNFQDAGAGTFIGFGGPNIYGTGNRAPVLADMSGGGAAPPAQSPAMVITRGGFSRWGSDALYNDSRMSLEPTIRVNRAIRLHGIYNIGGIRNKYRQTGTDVEGNGVGVAPVERYYMSQVSMNATDGVFGTWEQFRATMQTPWCIFSIGLKDFPMGIGATLGYNTRGESFLCVFPYGPFRFISAFWLARGRYLESWQSVPDGDTKNDFYGSLFITFDQGCLSTGGAVLYRLDHRNRGALPLVAEYGASTAAYNAPATTQQARDDIYFLALVYAKYFDGRFLANAEYAWGTDDRYYPVAQVGDGANAGGRPLHMEAYHWFSELGVVSGPAKLTLMYALSSGPVLNYHNPRKLVFGMPINWHAMEPYEFLMFNTFAGGNQGGWAATDLSIVADEHGQMTDAYCFGARADYALASNLNIWATYIWAHRLERAGFLNGGVRDVGNGAAGGVAPGTFLAAYGGTTPYCPDGYIGWEAGAGVDWKLLEGFSLRMRYAYWQPGDWFTYAYQALIPGGPYPGGSSTFSGAGVLQSRSPINAFEGKLVVEF